MVKFKVFRGENKKLEPMPGLPAPQKWQFYFHMILGNNEVVMQSEGYDNLHMAHKTINSIWIACGQSSGLMSSDISTERLLEHYPVPFTQDSLVQQ